MGEDCFEVPIFPLDVVLFPGMALPLHIFEPRYRLMTADCLADRASFGVVLAPADGEDECALIGRVGTLARISDCERLPEGRFNLLALGMRRFRILEVRRAKPYLTALVRPLDDVPATVISSRREALVREARVALRDYLRLVMTLIGSDEQVISIPESAEELSYVIGMCLTCEDCEKQTLLEITSMDERLESGIRALRDEIALLGVQFDSAKVRLGRLDRTSQDRASLN